MDPELFWQGHYHQSWDDNAQSVPDGPIKQADKQPEVEGSLTVEQNNTFHTPQENPLTSQLKMDAEVCDPRREKCPLCPGSVLVLTSEAAAHLLSHQCDSV